MKLDIKKHFPDACDPALDWYSTQPDFETAWQNCHRGDWMAWLAEQLGVEKRLLVLTGGRCAETVIHMMGDERSVSAVRVAIQYGEGKVSEAELINAASAAEAAAWEAWLAAEAAAAWSAARSAWSAAEAAKAARAAWSAEAAEAENQLKTADICRVVLTEAVFQKVRELIP